MLLSRVMLAPWTEKEMILLNTGSITLVGGLLFGDEKLVHACITDACTIPKLKLRPFTNGLYTRPPKRPFDSRSSVSARVLRVRQAARRTTLLWTSVPARSYSFHRLERRAVRSFK
jgi:hypothetical protein